MKQGGGMSDSLKYRDVYEQSINQPDSFWGKAAEAVQWTKKWDKVLDESKKPFYSWFTGGELNTCYNALDYHVESGRKDQVAIIYDSPVTNTVNKISYGELLDTVSRFAGVLSGLGVTKGDTVIIYMPMIPQAMVAMLACARIGAPHSVVFGGFSAEALRSRIEDAEAKVVITTDGQFRRGSSMPLKPAVDEAVEHCPTVQKVLVVRRTGDDVAWNDERDVWWHDVVATAPDTHEAQDFDAEHPLFILYTSGTTGKPKGILHTSGGYLTQASYTHNTVFDLKPETDVYWCTADIGWVTGHSYIVYGPLSNGATQVIV